MTAYYNIVMFAHNEEKNIRRSISSVLEASDDKLRHFYIIANGCSDRTCLIVKEVQSEVDVNINLIELDMGDKCNAWNYYIHSVSDDVPVHFFVDADVRFTKKAFPQMAATLTEDSNANAVAGLPFSGRNIETYKDMVTNGWSLFGNCYGLKLNFIQIIKNKNFKLPIGLGWIDSAITRIIYRDVDNKLKPVAGRITYNEQCGYEFDSLSVFKRSDWSLYLNRIVRYRLGKLQEKHLEKIAFENWPNNLVEINQLVLRDIKEYSSTFNFMDKVLVTSRINKFLKKMAVLNSN